MTAARDVKNLVPVGLKSRPFTFSLQAFPVLYARKNKLFSFFLSLSRVKKESVTSTKGDTSWYFNFSERLEDKVKVGKGQL